VPSCHHKHIGSSPQVRLYRVVVVLCDDSISSTCSSNCSSCRRLLQRRVRINVVVAMTLVTARWWWQVRPAVTGRVRWTASTLQHAQHHRINYASKHVSLHFAWRIAEAKCVVATAVCVSVCLSLAPFPHYCTDRGVTWGNRRGAIWLCTVGRICSRCTGFVAVTT